MIERIHAYDFPNKQTNKSKQVRHNHRVKVLLTQLQLNKDKILHVARPNRGRMKSGGLFLF